MIRIFTTLILTIYSILLTLPSLAQQTRIKQLFNEDWLFHKGDVKNGKQVTFQDSDWRKLDLPHDWSVEGPFSEQWASGTGYLPAGIGWYRKTFELPAELADKQVFIYFDGVYKNSEVWINGQYLGKRPNGYIAFQYELTQHLNPSGKNTLAVKVDHTDFADSRWYTGSGIYRNVYLIALEPIHIAQWGTAFITPKVTQDQATAQVSISVENQSKQAASVKIVSRIVDQQGTTVKEATDSLQIDQSSTAIKELSLVIDQPKLWSVEHPNLYQLETEVFAGNQKVDDLVERVGFRDFTFDADSGFSLNGENMQLKGVCFHHDAGALGAAVPKEVWRRRLQLMKAAGVNALRMSHYPHQDYIYDLADEMGFLVQDEAFDEWEVGKNKWIEGWNVGTPGKDGYHVDFREWADKDLRDMILRNRNHASIIMWSIGNEIDYPNDPYSHKVLDEGRNPQIYGRGYQPENPPASRLGELAEHLVDVAKKYDTSRPVTAALAGVTMSNFTKYPEVLDIVGYNYQEYRYPEDHQKYPDRIIYGSENGKSLDAWLAVDTNAYIPAQFLWTAFDFLGEARSWPSRNSTAGLMDLAGFPKAAYYFRQSLWSDKPMVHLATAKLAEEDRRQGPAPTWNWQAKDSVRISCFTNADEVELLLNGKSLNRKKLADFEERVIRWDMVYQPGTLVARAYQAGKMVASDTLQTAKKSVAFHISTDKKSLDAKAKDLVHVVIDIVDENGTVVYDANQEITVNVEGPAKLLGLESGDPLSHENYQANHRKAHHGKLLAYIQSAPTKGTITVSIAGKGLKTQKLTIPIN